MNKKKKQKLKTLLLTLLLGGLLAPSAFAHVGYILNETEFSTSDTVGYKTVLMALTNPTNLMMIFITIILVVGLISQLQHAPFVERILSNLERKEDDYQRIFPWAIRLSVGVALIGAGSNDQLISPVLAGFPELGGLQVLLGFFLFVGFLLELSILLAVILFLYGLAIEPYLLGNIDFLAMAIAFVLIGDDRPGVDDLLDLPCYCILKKMKDVLPLLLRIGVGVSMIYLAVYEKVLHPGGMMEVISQYNLDAIIPVGLDMWVFSTGVIEFIIGLCLLLGYHTRFASALAFFVLTLSFFFFGEQIYSHITIFGALSIIFVTGGNTYSIDDWMSRRLNTTSN